MNQQTVYQTVSVQDELPTSDVICFRDSKVLHFMWGKRPQDLHDIKATHWLKPTTGYFFTPEEFERVINTAMWAAGNGADFQTFYNQLTGSGE